MVGEDIYTIWQIFGPGGLIDKLGPDRAIRELKKRCDAGAIIGCSLYKLLIEKWIDVATGAKDPGQRGPAEDFMSSAGEDELVKKIEDLHVQYPNGIPRSIRMDVKDEWNAALEKKVGRRIPLDPKDASKKDIAESKKIAEQLAAGVGLPRPLKPKVGIEELPPPPPVKPVERPPPRAAPEVVPTPITTRAPPELELMKKEILERIEEEKRRRLKRGPIAGESSSDYLRKKISELPKEERLKVARAIAAAVPVEPAVEPAAVSVCPEIPLFIYCPTCKFKYSISSVILCPYRPEPTRFFREDVDVYSRWTYDDFKVIINRTTSIEDLMDLAKHIEESRVMTPADKVSARQLAEKRKRDIVYGTPEIKKQIEEQQREGQLVTASRLREDDIIKDDDVMQVPGDYTEWRFGDFEGQIPGLDDPEDLEEMLEYTDATDKLTRDEAKTLREMIKEQIRKVEKAGS